MVKTFDPSSFRLSQDFSGELTVKKVITKIPVDKPGKQSFVRVHPSPEWRFGPAGIIEQKEESERYLVDPALSQALAAEIRPVVLLMAVTRQGAHFLWPVNLPGPEGKSNPWNESAAEIAELAKAKWVRCLSNRALGAYEARVAEGVLPEPEWPDIPFSEVLGIAFRDRIIDSLDHPVVRKLRGLV